MTYLVDGYNLLYAVGLATRAMSGAAFDRARGKLLDWLADAVEGRGETVRVVFDAQKAPRPVADSVHRGVEVVVAAGTSADERIAALVAAARRPDAITVVSNDRPVREDASRRGCRVFACSEFVDWVLDRRRPAPPAAEPEKPGPAPSPDELAAWLAAFTTPERRGDG